MSSPKLGISGLLFAAFAPAQSTHVVTSWDGVQTAIAAASPGDVILLPNTGTPGTDYAPFHVDRPLTIVGNGCRIGSSLQQGGVGPVSITLGSGQRVHLDGLDLTQGYSPYGNIGTQLSIYGGTVTVQRCAVANGVAEAIRTDHAQVVLDRCTVTAFGFLGAGAGIVAANGEVTVRDCTVIGADAAVSPSPNPFQQAMPAVWIAQLGRLHAERTTFRGGDHAQTLFAGDGAPAIRADLGSYGWLADVTAIGGDSTQGSGGAGFANGHFLAWRIAQTTLVGGQPGGAPSTGTAPMVDTMARLTITPALQRGSTSTFAVQGGPGHGYGVLLAFDAAPTVVLGIVEPAWLVSSAPFFGGLLDAGGQATLPIAVPTLPPGIEVQVWFQAVSGPAWLQVHASTLAGGRVL